MAGYTGRRRNQLAADFIAFAQKLKRFGFTYYDDKIAVVGRAEL
jgi:hypothetical protein